MIKISSKVKKTGFVLGERVFYWAVFNGRSGGGVGNGKVAGGVGDGKVADAGVSSGKSGVVVGTEVGVGGRRGGKLGG